MAALRNFNGLASWKNAENSLQSVNLTMPTRAYVARRTLEGLSKREIMRCLKRYVAREIYRVLTVLTAPSSA